MTGTPQTAGAVRERPGRQNQAPAPVRDSGQIKQEGFHSGCPTQSHGILLGDSHAIAILQRTTRHVRVTDLGSLFYERAVEIVTLLDDAVGALQHGQATPVGLLRLSSPTSFGMLHVAPALCDFHAQYPALTCEIILNDRVVNPVEEGFDVCLQDSGPRPGSMVERRLFPLRRVVCAAPQYLATHGTPRLPQEVSHHACIQYSYLESGSVWQFDSSAGPITVPIDPILRTNNGRIMLDAAVQGKGIAVLPTFLAAHDLQRGTLVVLLPDFPFPALTLSAVYPRRKHVPAKVKLLLDFFVARFGSEPPWDRGLASLFSVPPGVLQSTSEC